MKKAIVFKHSTGYWVAYDRERNVNIGGFHATELDAYKAANNMGYLVD